MGSVFLEIVIINFTARLLFDLLSECRQNDVSLINFTVLVYFVFIKSFSIDFKIY